MTRREAGEKCVSLVETTKGELESGSMGISDMMFLQNYIPIVPDGQAN